MPTRDLDDIRRTVLDRVERGDRLVRLATLGAAAVELALITLALLYVDWKDRLQVLLFLFSVISYTIVVLGLVALAGHVTRTVGRVLSAIDPGALGPGADG
jgi:hypothetical protein